MKFLIFILLLFTISCSTNKVSKNHGYKSLETKYEKIKINVNNKNDITDIIGPPSSKSDFNENKWLYFERRKTNQSIVKLGIKKIEKNNILIVEFNSRGILIDKKLLDLNKMNDLKFAKSTTEKDFTQNNFIFNIFTSFREKINSASKK
tara:strand:- start:509 stop:955 length:447 start_codon:yes stop_codon:yes gene_type:complete